MAFTLTRFHRLPYWQRKYWPFGHRIYPLHIEGELHATTDGTRVTLRVAPQTRVLLHRAARASWWNLALGALLIAFVLCVIIAQIFAMILLALCSACPLLYCSSVFCVDVSQN